jgi:hypothetical protein
VATAAATLVIGLLAAGARVALPVAGYAAAGLAAGHALGARWRWDAALAAVVVTLVPGAAWVALETPVESALAAEAERARTVLAESLPADMDPAERAAAAAEQEKRLAEVTRVAATIWPGCLALGLAGIAAGLLGVVGGGARLAVRWRGLRPLPPFPCWRMPFYLVWILAAGLVLIVTRRPPLTGAGVNTVLFAATFLAIQGVAVQAFVVGRVAGPRWQWLYWLVAGLFFAPLVLASGLLLGLVDQWLDVRRIGEQDAGPRAPTG